MFLNWSRTLDYCKSWNYSNTGAMCFIKKNLKCQRQLDLINKKLSRFSGTTYRFTRWLNTSTAKCLYFCLFIGVLDYASWLWKEFCEVEGGGRLSCRNVSFKKYSIDISIVQSVVLSMHRSWSFQVCTRFWFRYTICITTSSVICILH